MKLARESGQQRFAPADLDTFLDSLPGIPSDSVHEAGTGNPQGLGATPSDGSDMDGGVGEGVRQMADLSFVPEERRGGVRQKRVNRDIRAMLKGKQRRVSPGQSHGSLITRQWRRPNLCERRLNKPSHPVSSDNLSGGLLLSWQPCRQVADIGNQEVA